MSRFDGKTTRRNFKKLRIDEISLVDTPAHGPALVAIMKRADTTEKSRMAVTTLTAGHAHSVIMVQASSEGLADLKAGETSYSDGHAHKWVMDDAGNVIIADAEGHNHTLAILVKDSDLSPDDGASASRSDKGQQAANSPAEAVDAEGTPSQDINMTDTKKTDAEVAAEAVQKQLEELTKANERQGQILKLSPEQRAHFDALEGDAADEFLKAEDKDAIVKNAADSDPVVYKSLDGDEFRKSDDPRLVKAAQRADKAEKAVAEAELVAKRNDLVKRAGEELAHLTGELTAKADLLGAVDSLPVEKREAVVAILKSKDAGMQKAFETLGTADAGADADSPAAKLDTLAKAKAEANPNLTPEQAYSAVLDTPEGRELHAQL